MREIIICFKFLDEKFTYFQKNFIVCDFTLQLFVRDLLLWPNK